MTDKERSKQEEKALYEAYGIVRDNDNTSIIDTPIDIEWTPLSNQGERFKSLKIKQINPDRIELHKTKSRYIFCIVLAFIGLCLFMYGAYRYDENQWLNFAVMGPMIIGSLLTAIALYYFIFPVNSTFDRRYDWYWRGNKTLSKAKDFNKLKKAMRLSNIAAIQVLTESYDYDDQNSYIIWEINLVSKSGSRLNVIDIGDKASILKDAQKLADFLAVPIWSNEKSVK